jgi:YjbE family integral membrane protein
MFIYSLFLLCSVIFLDLILSGDNAVVIAMAANGLPKEDRDKAITIGMGAAVVLRVLFALFALFLLAWHIFAFLGGFLLLWVAYKMGRDLYKDSLLTGQPPPLEPLEDVPTAFWKAIGIIAAADVSMSLDNVLAVASLARNHPFIMGMGFLGSMIMLTWAARKIADLMEGRKWLSWVGLVLIVWVAIDLIVGNYDATLTLMRS